MGTEDGVGGGADHVGVDHLQSDMASLSISSHVTPSTSPSPTHPSSPHSPPPKAATAARSSPQPEQHHSQPPTSPSPSQEVRRSPFVARRSFWAGEGDCPLMQANAGYLREGECEAAIAQAQGWTNGLPPHDTAAQATCVPHDTSSFVKVCQADARRTFLTGEYRRETVLLLHRVGSCTGDYHQAVGQVAAFLSLVLSADDALALILKLHEREHLAGYYTGGSQALMVDAVVWSRLLKRRHPDCHAMLEECGAVPEAYLPRWFLAVFTDVLPFSALFDLMDHVFRDGIVFLFKFGLSVINGVQRWLQQANEDLALILRILHLDRESVSAFSPAFCAKLVQDACKIEFDANHLLLMRAQVRQELGLHMPVVMSRDALRYEGGVGAAGEREGEGRMVWASGDTYTGSMVHGEREGHGRHMYSNGDVYEGLWKGDVRHGKGRLECLGGEVYTGEWVDDQRCGMGRLTTSRGDEYEGEWMHDRCHGQGEQRLKQSGDRYVGQWHKGRRQGQGTYHHADGSIYEGEFDDGMCHGHGMMKFNQSKSQDAVLYEGEWQRGRIEGTGTIFYSDASMYTGHFVNARRHGKGMLTFPNGNVYDGAFDHDRLTGKGVIDYRDGSKYEGDFVDGVYHGLGRLTGTPVGDYHGGFQLGKKHGMGTFQTQQGDKFEGTFQDDLLHGHAQHWSCEGWKDEGPYVMGVKVGVHTRTHLQSGKVTQIRFLKSGRQPRKFF